jgi:hypothetical protein
MYRLVLVSAVVELALFPSIEAIVCPLISYVGLRLLRQFLFTPYNLLHYMVSTVAIFMYVVFFLVLPMPATLLEFKPVTFNMHDTIWTYTNILMLEMLLMITHKVYRHLFGPTNWLGRLLLKTPVYDRFTNQELWTSIIVGNVIYFGLIYTYGLYQEDANVYQELPPFMYALNSIFAGFANLIMLPLFRKFGVITTPRYRIPYVLIIVLSFCSFVVGIATNMRTAALSVISFAVFAYVYYFFLYVDKRTITPKKVVTIIAAAGVFMAIFLPISQAMRTVRGDRTSKSGAEVLSMTMQAKSTLKEEETEFATTRGYSEAYLDNDVLGRFCSIKIHDETLYRAQQIGYNNPRMKADLYFLVLSDLPKVIKNKLGIPKSDLHTLTDELCYLSCGYGLGGAHIGTLQGLGLATYGWWYLLVVFVVYLFFFPCMDSVVYFTGRNFRFSWLFFQSIIMWCYWFSDRHYYQSEYRFFMRGFLEMVVFGIISIWVIKHLPLIKHR